MGPPDARGHAGDRGSLWDVAGRTSDPERALATLLARDALFTDRLAAQTARLGLPAVRVEVGTTEDELADRVAGVLGL